MTNSELLNFLKTTPKYTKRFRAFLPFIFEWENVIGKGGKILVEDVEGDGGGRTVCGIDIASHPNFDFVNFTPTKVCDLYYDAYWLKNKCETYPINMGECVMNCCVNAGTGRANIILQTAKNASQFIEEQENFYRRLAAQKPRMSKFLKGWLNRTRALKEFLKA